MHRTIRWDALELEKITEMIARKTIAGARQRLTQTYVKKGALVPRHVHEGEQMIYVLQGALRLVIGEEDLTLREGEVAIVPPGVPHQAEALDDTFVLSVSQT